MRKPLIIWVIFALILISCNKKEAASDTYVPYLPDLTQEFSPTHVVIERRDGIFLMSVFAEPDDLSRVLWYLDLGETVQLLGYKYAGNDTTWYHIRTKNDTIGWSTKDYFMDITDVDQSSIAMNRIDLKKISILDKNGQKRLIEVTGEHSEFIFEYGMNMVEINYYRKDYEFDGDFMHDYYYRPNLYFLMDIYAEKKINNFPSIFFNTNRRINNKNGITLVDSFCFSAHEAEDQRLMRMLFFSTNNYNIAMWISFPYEDRKRIFDQIANDTPDYFLIRDYHNQTYEYYEYSEQNKEKGSVIWDYRNDARERFGADLINNMHNAKILNKWFAETEDLLAGLTIE
jgi:hypothetical protein